MVRKYIDFMVGMLYLMTILAGGAERLRVLIERTTLGT